MLHSAVALSIILGFASQEFLGASGGLVSAGYLAFYFEQPLRIISTLLLSILTVGIVKLLKTQMIIYGRRRFMITVLVSMLLSYVIEKSFFYAQNINQDIRVVGYIIPGLIANDMEKQGILRTLPIIVINSSIIWLVIHLRLLA